MISKFDLFSPTIPLLISIHIPNIIINNFELNNNEDTAYRNLGDAIKSLKGSLKQ